MTQSATPSHPRLSHPNLPLALLILRLTVGAFFLIWAVEKIVAPEAAILVSETFYGTTPDRTTLLAVGVAQLVLIGVFLAGLWKTLSYGALLAIHAASVATTWERLINPYELPNHLFWAGVPVLALMLALFLLREADVLLTWRQRV